MRERGKSGGRYIYIHTYIYIYIKDLVNKIYYNQKWQIYQTLKKSYLNIIN